MDFLGQKYELVRSENFEAYLAFTGVGFMGRKVASTLTPVSCLSMNSDNTFTFSFNSMIVNSSIMFSPGVEFDEIKPDGKKVRSLITLEDNKMIHIQKDENGQVAKHIRVFHPDEMFVTTTVDGWDKVLTRYYKAIN